MGEIFYIDINYNECRKVVNDYETHMLWEAVLSHLEEQPKHSSPGSKKHLFLINAGILALEMTSSSQ